MAHVSALHCRLQVRAPLDPLAQSLSRHGHVSAQQSTSPGRQVGLGGGGEEECGRGAARPAGRHAARPYFTAINRLLLSQPCTALTDNPNTRAAVQGAPLGHMAERYTRVFLNMSLPDYERIKLLPFCAAGVQGASPKKRVRGHRDAL